MRCSSFRMRSDKDSSVSSSFIGTTACKTIGPASRFSSTKWTVQPANFTPYSRAWPSDSKRGDEVGGEQAHVSGEADEIGFGFLEGGDDLTVVGFAFETRAGDDARGEA